MNLRRAIVKGTHHEKKATGDPLKSSLNHAKVISPNCQLHGYRWTRKNPQEAIKDRDPCDFGPVSTTPAKRRRTVDYRWREELAIMNRLEVWDVKGVGRNHVPRRLCIERERAATNKFACVFIVEKRHWEKWLCSIEYVYAAVSLLDGIRLLPRKFRNVSSMRY